MDKPISHKHPLASRLAFLIMLFSLTITLIAMSLLLYRQYQHDLQTLDERLKFIETSTLPSLQNSLWEFNDDQVETILNGLLDLENIVAAEVTSVSWDGKPTKIKAQKQLTSQTQNLQRSFPVVRVHQNKVTELGQLTVTASLSNVYQNLLENTGYILVTLVITTILITIVILSLIRWLLTRHLASIARHAKNLKLDEEQAPLVLKRASREFSDELDEVVNALNNAHQSFLQEKRRELKAEKQKAWLEASSQAKSDFLSQMSHEIRTPMNGVIGLLELIDEGKLDPEQQQYLKMIKQSGQSLLAIINDVLDFSKIEAGKLSIVKRNFSVHDIVHECASLYTASAKEKNIDVKVDINLGVEDSLLGDPVRIKQVLLNFISNAFKYTEKGSISISVNSEHKLSSNKHMVRFSVKDTGIGIDENYKQKIFGAFDQGNPLTNRDGTGLGLSISKKLIDAMGGHIEIESSLGQGSEFSFAIPLELANKTSLKTSENKQAQQTHPIKFAHPVLIAEDNTINIQVASGLLRKLNVEFETVSNGLEAVKNIRDEHKKYSVILMDSEMPVMNGFEATREIRNYEKENNLQPCIIVSLSAHFNEAHKKQCLAVGMNHHISKPITLNDIQQLFLNIMNDTGDTQITPGTLTDDN